MKLVLYQVLTFGCACEAEQELGTPVYAGKIDPSSDAHVQTPSEASKPSGQGPRDAGSVRDEQWLDDADSWREVQVTPVCAAKIALDPRRSWPPLKWSKCGVGCERADLYAGDREWAGALNLQGWRVSGEALQISTTIAPIEPKGRRYVFGLFEYGDGAPRVLLQSGGDCMFAPQRDSTTALRLMRDDLPLVWVDAAEQTIAEVPNRQGIDSRLVDFGSSWGASTLSSLHVAPSPLSSTVNEVHRATGTLLRAVGLDGHVVWSEWTEQGRVFAWSSNQGVVLLAESSAWYPSAIGLSPDRFVWVGVTGPLAIAGAYETAQFFSCARRAELERCEVKAGPMLPMTGGELEVATFGRWAAVAGLNADQRRLFLTDLDTNAGFEIVLPPETASASLAGMSDTHLYAQDFKVGKSSTTYHGWLRYDLELVQEFGNAL